MLNNNSAQATGLQVFNFRENEGTLIRVRVINNEPWFVAKDVCDVLGLSNSRKATAALDADERKDGVTISDTVGRTNYATVVNESGLYHLIFQSRKPEAKKFRKWVTGEVLPAIRKTGRYETIKSRMNDGFLDLRDVPYENFKFKGGEVRMVENEGVKWYSINDVFRCIGSCTESTQSVRRLSAKCNITQKILLFGMTNPGWFTTLLGVQLLLSASKKVESDKELTLNFSE